MGLRTPLFATHVAAGARMVDFGGWDMPVNYGSQIDEHHAVRCGAGMFDVSHMCVIDLTGTRVREFLRYLLANDVARLQAPGKALYSCMLNERGGVIDDLIVYFLNEQFFRVVVNAGTRDKDIAWIRQHAANYAVTVQVRDDLAMIAVQGPQARATVATVLAQPAVLDIPVFTGCAFDDLFVARTGYTGEDGFEIMLPATVAADCWARLQAAGVALCGLGARDTLRLEAGMNLYGNDMDEDQSPLESGLAWTVVFDPAERSFIGRAALDAQRAQGVARKLVGLVLEERGVLRAHQTVLVDDLPAGEITSGTFAPTLERSIALARVPVHASGVVKVDIRGKALPARVVKYPFVRHGKALVAL